MMFVLTHIHYHVFAHCVSCISSLSFPQPLQKLSSSLKERLKRSRRSFTSPLSVAKRLRVDDLEEGGRQVSADSQETVNNPPLITHDVDVNRNDMRSGSERFSGPIPEPTQLPLKDQLRKEVKDKTEILRRLKMVKMYRSKVSDTFKLPGRFPT